MTSRATIIGTGSCLPRRILSNQELETIVETTDEWITTRTGIKNRRIGRSGEETSKLAAGAARQALEMAGLVATDLDQIIVATVTSEMTMPSCACLVQKELGATRAFAYDVNAACSGFVYGLDLAEKYIRAEPDLKILVIGAETMSTRINWQDRNTCVLFGDGAGACIVTGNNSGRGMLASQLYSDGRLFDLLKINCAASMNPDLSLADHDGSYIQMAGRDVFKYAVRSMEKAASIVLDKTNLDISDVKLIIPHQANIRILKSLADHLGTSLEKVYINLDKYGNTSAASVPIALDEANREGCLQENDLLLLCCFGGGFTWGAMMFRW
ncbi:MAG: beta-ketoacyl-ACP synthase III [Thermodesulfobacteriota bacterium]|nr:beta-ketoacyl-ACP synthase III [Thermodesulfobacteriota bacterium]